MSDIKIPDRLVLEPAVLENENERHFASSERPPEQKFKLYDTKSKKVWGYVVVDDTRRGPGLGGIRIAKDLSLWEVIRLAKTMTLKNSGANIPFGGAKSGIIFDPSLFGRARGLKQDLIEIFAEAIYPIENYIAAPDMGTDENDTQRIFQFNANQLGNQEHGRGAAGRPYAKGWIPIDKWGLAAHSVYASIKTLEEINPRFKIKDSRVVVQGYGNVGAAVANKLYDDGAVIVGASDINAALWNSKGLTMKELNMVRGQEKGLAEYKSKVDKRFHGAMIDRMIEAPCDILIPAARPDAITIRNADHILATHIFHGANSVSNRMIEYYLQNRRNIISYTDFIVHAGGVIGCAVEIKMTQNKKYRDHVLEMGGNGRTYVEKLISDTVSKNIFSIIKRMKEEKGKDILFREVATKIAEERLAKPKDIWL